MRAVVEVLLSLCSVLGLLALGWLWFGRLLTPAAGGGGAWVVLPARGGGEGLEQAVRGLLWLRGSGLLSARVAVVDCGLDARGSALVRALLRRWPELELSSAAGLPALLSPRMGRPRPEEGGRAG